MCVPFMIYKTKDPLRLPHITKPVDFRDSSLIQWRGLGVVRVVPSRLNDPAIKDETFISTAK